MPKPAVTDLEWGLKAIGVDEARFTGKGVDICILDTGFDVSHPDFAERFIEESHLLRVKSGTRISTDTERIVPVSPADMYG